MAIGGIKVSRVAGRLRRQKFLVQRLDGGVLFLRLGLRFLLRLHLLGSQPLARRLRRRFLLKVNVLDQLVQADSDTGHVEELFSLGIKERDFVLAGS